MNKKYSEEIARAVVGKSESGQSVALLCVEYGIPCSTVYFWIKRHQKLKENFCTIRGARNQNIA